MLPLYIWKVLYCKNDDDYDYDDPTITFIFSQMVQSDVVIMSLHCQTTDYFCSTYQKPLFSVDIQWISVVLSEMVHGVTNI